MDVYDELQDKLQGRLTHLPNVIYSGSPTDGCPVDNLDEIAVKGWVIFQNDHDDFWGKGVDYVSEAIENPTWMQLCKLCDDMIKITDDYHHVFFEAIQDIGTDEKGIKIFTFSMGS